MLMAMHKPSELVDYQWQCDLARNARHPELLRRKAERMSLSPFAFLRGSAPLYWHLLATEPWLAAGPDGTGWLTGDLHLENFGAFRPEAPAHGDIDKTVFDINDFDDATRGPWRHDLLRLTTSLALVLRDAKLDGHTTIHHLFSLLRAWNTTASGEPLAAEPPCVTTLLQAVRNRSRRTLLEARTEVHGDHRKLLRNDKLRPVDAELAQAAQQAFALYVHEMNLDFTQMRVLDVALRVAGTGSLGTLRLAVLVAGKGGRDGAWLFDMKEQGDPSSTELLPRPDLQAAERAVAAMRAGLQHPPKLCGATTLVVPSSHQRLSMLVRRLTPQEDRIDWSRLAPSEIHGLIAYLGGLAGQFHHRGAQTQGATWQPSDMAELVEKAIYLAGLHTSAWLAYAKRAGSA